MIHRDDVIPLLLDACPSFAPVWNEHRDSGMYDAELVYLHLGEFARHVVRVVVDGSTGELPAIFAAAERLHLEGDDFVKEAATIGLLEGIQNSAAHAGLDPEIFVSFLGRESRRWWEALDRFWSGESPRVQ